MLLTVWERVFLSEDSTRHDAQFVRGERQKENAAMDRKHHLQEEEPEERDNTSETPSNGDQPKPVVTPEKKKPRVDDSTKEEDEKQPAAVTSEGGGDETVTADTIMGFSRYPNKTNRDIMLDHFDFVRWARKQDNLTGVLNYLSSGQTLMRLRL